jgi:predicted dehydrogenase|tara:strand:- start:1831 stop:2790 length:960 start_codon:yes stop_codon:yes gene_type:complete
MTHRVGIIGLGTVGARFVEQFNHHTDFDLVAAWDPDAAACAMHAADVKIVADAASVVSAADAVYIAVPPLFHSAYVEQCINAQVAIFCEKPLGINVQESRRLVDLVDSSGLPAGVNFVFSAAPSAVELQRRVASGEIGQIVRGDLRLHFAEWPRAWHAKAQWLRLRDQGGWVREVASHFVFIAQRMLGPLSMDTSMITYLDGPTGTLCETDALARMTGSKAPLVMIGTSEGAGPDMNDLTIRGTAGSLRIWDWYRLQHATKGEWNDVLGTDRAQLGADAYAAQLDELSKLLDGTPSNIATFAESLAVQVLVEAMLGGAS